MYSKRLITLKTNDGEEFKLYEAVIIRSQVIKNIVEDVARASNSIPLSNIDGKTMTKVIEYWKKHSQKGVLTDQLNNFGKSFLKMHHSVVYDVLLAANNFEDNLLRDVMIQEVVDRIKGKITEEMREEFGIKNDEKKIHAENVKNLVSRMTRRRFMQRICLAASLID
ncbi:hypothetical protein KY290_001606 [Solanum tuberosum]|uniref:SKP1-like protein n=1 Tax=Solanum tuberosum TaxID=4113 RepID=A0ABQ7WPN3_SOLTU|nr:hypothetical protein KY284_001640 [Solanum tuberosum]KAH0782008.1 hypothetical protein KY290_001606 [Solanum tuberosum]